MRNLKVALASVALIWFSGGLYGQMQPIDVTDQTIKFSGLGGEQTLYYGFEAGDQIIFNFKELNGKELKVVEVGEYPSNIKIQEYKTSQVQDKVINVSHRGIWLFHFSNSALGGRVCQIKIQRIPANEAAKNFNTDVVWRNINDTTYMEETERYLVKSDTSISNFDQTVTVHSRGNHKFGNKNEVAFSIPEHTIAWSYYIGVDENKSGAYAKAAVSFTQGAAGIVKDIPGGALPALALYGVSYFTQLTSSAGDAVDFYIVDINNANMFSSGVQIANAYKYGIQAVNSFARMTIPLQGSYYVCLQNDNMITPMDVMVKMAFVTVNQQWGTRPIKKMNIVTKNLPFCINNY